MALFLPASNFADTVQANNAQNSVTAPQQAYNLSNFPAADQAILKMLNSPDSGLTPAQQQVIDTWVNNNLETNGTVSGVLANFQTMLTALNNNGTLAIQIFQNNENSASLGNILSTTPVQYAAAQAIARNALLTSTQQQLQAFIDRALASSLGITASNVANALMVIGSGGVRIAQFSTGQTSERYNDVDRDYSSDATTRICNRQ